MQRPSAAWRIALLILALVSVSPISPVHAADSRLAGQVVDADTQKPIAGATVELANTGGGQGYFRARTDGRGAFHLERIAPERWYSLTVSAPGYADFVIGSWQIPSAQRSAEVVVPLDKAGSIEVKVVAGDGRTPVANAKVSARSERASQWWEGYRPPPAPMFADANGVARFLDLPAGTWSVSAESEGLLAFQAQNLPVRRGETTPVSARMVKPGRISGRVQLADGTGIAGVGVVARGPAQGVGTSGADGLFSVEDLPPGKYRLLIQQEGFAPAASAAEIALTEGGVRENVTLTATPNKPELALVLQREAFTLDEKVTLALRSFRIGVVDFTLFEIPTARLTDGARDFRALATNADTSGLKRIRTWQRPTANGPPYAWREEELTLPAQDLLPGAYLLRASAGTLRRGAILFVTDLGLIVKRSPERMMVSADGLKTGEPVDDALITVVGGPASTAPGETPRWEASLGAKGSAGGKVDGSGLLMLPMAGAQRVRVVAVSPSHGVAVADASYGYDPGQAASRALLFTERPIYRPGQTVFWKAIARTRAGEAWALPDATTASLSVNGPDGASLPVPAGKLSTHGSADGAIALPRDLPLGDWTLHFAAGGASAAATFAVQEYRKPEFSVDVTPDREVYVNGDEVRFRVAATYFFGAPVFGATVRYNLFETRMSSEEWNWDDGEGWPSSAGGYGRVLKTGEARTDADGRVALTFTPGPVSYDRRLTLEAEVVDGAKRQVSGRGSAIMGRGLFALTIRPITRVTNAGQPITIEVTARDHAGKPVATPVTVTVDQEAWNPLERRYARSTRPLAESKAATGANGVTTVTLTPPAARAGSFILRARADDARGNRITAETTIWAWDDQVSDYAYRYTTLEAWADRERYAPRDTARILVNTEVRNARILVAVEGRDLYEARIVPLAGNTRMISIPIKPEYAPNVFVAIHVRNARQVQTRTLELAVAAQRHDLTISLTPDKAEYRPRETVTLGIETKDAKGAPAPAEVALGVVDEAIYGLRPDHTPDPHEVFYGRRPNLVSTVVSFPILYYGGADKGGKEDVRRDFRDVAFWAPAIQTDAAGHAQVKFPWPDNLTTWRFTARGASDRTEVGKAIAKTLVTKEIVARLALPRQLVAGDEAQVISIVTNRSKAPLAGVTEAIEVGGQAKLAGASSRKSDIAPGGESRGVWRVTMPAQLPATADTAAARFQFRARSKADADALELMTPVKARAVATRPHGAGVLSTASAAETVVLPTTLVRPGSSLALDLSPSPAAMALGAVDWLYDYTYGCTEQTSNAVLPACALIAAARAADVRIPGWDDPARKLAPALDRLAALQGPDGGWGWWRGDESDPYMTALALHALRAASRLGIASSAAEQALSRAQGSLMMTLAHARSRDGEAYLLAHLSPLLPGEGESEMIAGLKDRLSELATSVHTSRAELSTAGLALATVGAASLHRDAEARQLFALLEKRARRDGAGLSWPRDEAQAWWGDEEENSGYALTAMLQLDPKDARAVDVVRWLAAHRRGRYWRSTRSTGPVAIALATYLQAHAAEMKPDMRIRVTLNGAPLIERAIGVAEVFGGQGLRVEVPGSKLKPGANALVLTRDGSGSLYWSWEAKALVPSPGPPTGAESRMTVTREYLHVERTSDRRGRPQYLTSPLQGPRVGQSIMVRLTVHAAEKLDWLILEDPLAAGFEVDALLPDGAEWPWGAHGETRDDRAVFFLDHLDTGDTVLEYLVRPEMAGSVTALPAAAGGFYDPDLLARSGDARLTIAP